MEACPALLIYRLSNMLWDANLRYLDSDVKRISFEEIREPTSQINNRLHDRREELAQLKSGVAELDLICTLDYMNGLPSKIQEPHSALLDGNKRILKEAHELEIFLMDTFQLLMSSLSVQDSQTSIQQTRRSTLITWLAFIYVPLSCTYLS